MQPLNIRKPTEDSFIYIIPYMYRCLKHVIFEVFAINWSSVKFSSLKSYWQNFGLDWLESRVHVNSYVWHLQGMMACFDLTSSSQWGSLESGYRRALFDPFHMAPIMDYDISILGAILIHQTRDKHRGHVAKCRLLGLTSLARSI